METHWELSKSAWKGLTTPRTVRKDRCRTSKYLLAVPMVLTDRVAIVLQHRHKHPFTTVADCDIHYFKDTHRDRPTRYLPSDLQASLEIFIKSLYTMHNCFHCGPSLVLNRFVLPELLKATKMCNINSRSRFQGWPQRSAHTWLERLVEDACQRVSGSLHAHEAECERRSQRFSEGRKLITGWNQPAVDRRTDIRGHQVRGNILFY
jgi:hypothetical protein